MGCRLRVWRLARDQRSSLRPSDGLRSARVPPCRRAAELAGAAGPEAATRETGAVAALQSCSTTTASTERIGMRERRVCGCMPGP